MNQSMYSRARGQIKPAPKPNDIWVTEPSPVDGRPLKRMWRTLDSDQLGEKITLSKNNARLIDGLTRESLSDILPSMEQSKINTYPVYAVQSKDDPAKYELFDGFRRYSSIRLIPGGKLQMVIYQDLTEDEKNHFIKVSELKRKVSIYEWGLQITRFLQDESAEGRSWMNKELVDIFPLSETAISNALNVIKLPIDFVRELPTFNHVSATWARSILSLKLPEEDLLAVAQSYERPEQKAGEDSDDYAKRIRIALLDQAKAIKAQSKPSRSRPAKVWESMPAGIKASQAASGAVKISIGPKALNSEQRKQLQDLLTSFSESEFKP